jgi:RNA polymerase sigma-70 factor (ECF subfamily)
MSTSSPLLAAAAADRPATRQETLKFEQVYGDYAPFVWTNARRLGVPVTLVDDVVQDVFVVVYRRLAEFDGRSSVKTWVCSILMNVVRERRRRFRRKEANENGDDFGRVAARGNAPDEQAVAAEALRLVQRILSGMSEEKRDVIILAQLEGMSIPEIAEATGENLNTIYSRHRAARREFAEAYERACLDSGRTL